MRKKKCKDPILAKLRRKEINMLDNCIEKAQSISAINISNSLLCSQFLQIFESGSDHPAWINSHGPANEQKEVSYRMNPSISYQLWNKQ